MPRIPPKKCLTCSQLSAAVAQELHGQSGDQCWNPNICHARRTYYRHRQKYIHAKWQRRHSLQDQQHSTEVALEVEVDLPADYAIAVIQIYRSSASADTHAVGAELWRGGKLISRVRPVHCLGLTEGQVKKHLRQVLRVLSQQHGVDLKGFGSTAQLDPVACPLSPCPLHPERSDELYHVLSQP